MKYTLTIFFLFAAIPGVFGIGISPVEMSVVYQPGLSQNFTYTVFNNADQEIQASIHFDGAFKEYFTSMPEAKKIGAHSTEKFNIELNFPDEVVVPGLHEVLIIAVEGIPEEAGSLAGVTRAVSTFFVDVPYPEQYAEFQILVPHINDSSSLTISFPVINKGEKNIGRLEIFGEIRDYRNETVWQFTTAGTSLKARASKTLAVSAGAGVFVPGEYKITAFARFDGKIAGPQLAEFRVGTFDITVSNSTEELVVGEIGRYDFQLESNWNELIKNVYAEVRISNGTEVLSSKTPFLDIGPFEKIIFTAYLDLREFDPGRYKTDIIISFGEEKKIVERFIELKESDFEVDANSDVILLLVVIMIILAVDVVLLKKKWKRVRVEKNLP